MFEDADHGGMFFNCMNDVEVYFMFITATLTMLLDSLRSYTIILLLVIEWRVNHLSAIIYTVCTYRMNLHTKFCKA